MKLSQFKDYIKMMWNEATMPVGTKFEQKIDGQWVQVSRARHLFYMHSTIVQLLKAV